jgi:tRNA modification GTPase
LDILQRSAIGAAILYGPPEKNSSTTRLITIRGAGMDFTDTITALATSRGTAALAIIRISGAHSFGSMKQLVAESERFDAAKNRMIHRYQMMVAKTGEIIDEVTAIKYSAPHSYTGEDMVEIICHGGSIIVDRLLAALIESGIRYAQPGEFTRRAFLNGKKTLEQAEAMHQMISSKTRNQHRDAIKSYLGTSGSFSKWKDEIENIVVETESLIEFSDDMNVQNSLTSSEIIRRLNEISSSIGKEVETWKKLQEKEYCLEVIIAGPPNAGKSSLLNAMVGYDRSIVHALQGTTRDIISAQVMFQGHEVQIIDTAGLCKTDNPIEQIGIERAWHYIQRGDVVVWVTAANEELKPEEIELIECRKSRMQRLIAVINKIDLDLGADKEKTMYTNNIQHIKTALIKDSAKEAVVEFIKKCIQPVIDTTKQSCILFNTRQEACLVKVQKELSDIKTLKPGQEEILAYHCKTILDIFDEFTGKKSSEEIINQIFSQFCVGK